MLFDLFLLFDVVFLFGMICFVFGLCFSTNASADPQFTDLDEGEAAPFAGKLFNYEAVSELIVDKDSSVNQLLSRDDQWYSEQGSKFQKIDIEISKI